MTNDDIFSIRHIRTQLDEYHKKVLHYGSDRADPPEFDPDEIESLLNVLDELTE